jgi:hypothetical protein
MASVSKKPGRPKSRATAAPPAKAAVKAAPRKAKAAEPAAAFHLTDLLAHSSWHEADAALAKALRDFASLERVSQSLGRKLRGSDYATHAERMEGALLAVTQSLRNAGRRRNMQRFGEPGGVEDFNEKLHALDKPAKKKPVKVRVLTQGVARGLGPDAEIILKAQVAAVRMRATGARRQDDARGGD